MAVKGDASTADGNFGEMGAHLGIKPIAVDAEVHRRIAMADKARLHALLLC